MNLIDKQSTPPRPSGFRRLSTIGAIGLVLAVLAVLAVTWPSQVTGVADVLQELRDRGRVAVVGGADLLQLEAPGAVLVTSQDVTGLDAALDDDDEDVLVERMREQGVAALLVDVRYSVGDVETGSLRDRMMHFDRMDRLQAAFLTPVVALYVRRRIPVLSDSLRDAMAVVARRLLAGALMPSVRSFPEPLRRAANVEVMVMIQRGDQPRLWRSARGGSLARALLTAASVARERWQEREQAMGGPLVEQLPELTVKVLLLGEDGTLGDRSAAFVERVFTPQHGVAFERRGSWHYLLPDATRERGEGSAVAAYEALFDDAALTRDSFDRVDLRFYRLVAREVASASPPARAVTPTQRGIPSRLNAPSHLDAPIFLDDDPL